MKVQRLTLILSLIFAIFLSIYFRILPAFLLFTYPEVRVSLEEEVFKKTKDEIQKEYPYLAEKLREKLILRTFNQKIKGKEFSLLIKERVKELKDKFQDEDGINYLQEIDNYRWLRYIKNLLRFGHVGDRVIKGKQYDDLTLSPVGSYIAPHLGSIWTGFLFHRIFSFFKSDLPLTLTMSIIPLIIVSAICLFSFSIAYKFGGIFSGIFSCLGISLSPVFLYRSSFGWFDTDIYNILFPLVILQLYLKLEDSKKKILCVLLLSFFVGLYSFFWTGWWYIFNIFFISMILSGLLSFFIKREKRELNSLVLNLSLFTLFSLLFVSIFLKDLGLTLGPFLRPFNIFTELKSPAINRFWPNVYLTVAELRGANIFEIIRNTNGVFFFLFSLFGVVYLIAKGMAFDREEERKVGVLLFIWILVSLFASLKGVRFSLLLVVPVSIGCGIGVGIIYSHCSQVFEERFLKREKLFQIALVSLLVLPLGVSSFRAGVICRDIKPLMNDLWYRILNKVKQDTPKETIINSWWDYGDWYKVISERRVTFDAGSQNTPVAYWMAKFFLADSEEKAVGILRMLNNGSNRAFDELVESGLDGFKAIEILNRIIPLSKDKAEEILKEYLPGDRVNSILNLTHKIPEVTSLLILDKSLIDKIKAISFVGNWSHTKLDIWLRSKELKKRDFLQFLVDRYKYSQAEAEDIYSQMKFLDRRDLFSWVSYIIYQSYSKPAKGEKENDFILFDNSLVLNLSNKKAKILGKGIPKGLYFIEEDQLEEIEYEDANLDFSCLVFSDESGYKSVFVDPPLAKSMLTRLAFLKAKTLKHFQLLYQEEKGQDFIYIYRVNF